MAMAAATSRSPWSAAHRNAVRRLASSVVNQCTPPAVGGCPTGPGCRFRARRSSEHGRCGPRWPRRGRRVVPRRTGGSSPASKTGSAPKTGRRPAATYAPARPADPARRSRRSHRIRLPRRHFGGRTHPRTPNTAPAATSPRRRGGRRTTPPRGAACGGVPARAASRPAAGTADRDDHAPRSPSSTPSARPPTRWPAVSRRGAGRSPPPRRPHQPWPPRSARQRCGRVRQTGSPPRSRCPHRTSSEGTSHNCSSATPNPSRLVANTRTVAECARIASTRSAAASRTCSQLSNTNNRTRPSNAAATLSATALARLLGDAQHRGHRVGHRRRIGDRGQFEQPDAVRELVGQPRRDFGRQAGLADPAHPGQRHQPMSLQRLLHLGQFCLASDEARRLRAQVSRCRVERLKGRKLADAGRRPGLGTSRRVWRCRVIAAAPRPSGRCCCTARQWCRRAEPARRARQPSPAPHG